MASNSVYKAIFTLKNSAGATVAGPYTTFVGVASGTRGDVQSPAVASALVTAITNNLLGILQASGFAGSAVPGGTVTLGHFDHAASPDMWT